MDLTHLHLTLVHVPVFGTFFGTLLFLYGMFSKNNVFLKAGFLTFIATALISIPAFLTGDSSKEALQKFPGISENRIEEHEEIAEKAIWLVEFLGIISLIGFYFVIKNLKRIKLIVMITFLVSVITFGIMAVVGNSGGKIRHSEIDNSSTVENNVYKR